MDRNLLIWLIVCLAGLSQFPETVYTPSLPEVAHFFHIHPSIAEYTLTIYLFGFGIGVLFFGYLSDQKGRKPCVLIGLLTFIVGCLICYFSQNIEYLMMGRFIQSFGASIGSVLGQAITRDVFHGKQLGKAYATVSTALSFFPAIGPLCGGYLAEHFHWSSNFLFLACFGFIVFLLMKFYLFETHTSPDAFAIRPIASQLLRDKKVIGCGLIVALCNGIMFSYFAEGSFYLIDYLNLSPSKYGQSFIPIACSTFLGGMVAKKIKKDSITIINLGIWIIFTSTFLFSLLILIHNYGITFSKTTLIFITIISQMLTSFGICMTISYVLSLALTDYKKVTGTASSLFGFFYYCFIALFMWGMGWIHTGSLLCMPLYFLFLSTIMLLIKKMIK